jgi:deoxyribose-phosphate aldolase
MSDSLEAVEPVAPGPTNPGTPFDREAVFGPPVDEGEIERRVRALDASVQSKDEAVADLLAIVACLDLTSLGGDESITRIRELCAAARRPLPDPLVEGLGPAARGVHAAAVCIHTRHVALAAAELAGSGIPVAAVGGGFPAALDDLALRVADVGRALEAGAREIDLVIRRELALAGAWEELYRELRELRRASGSARLKVILAAGDLPDLASVARAGRVALMAGADFLKTSTGRDRTGATLAMGIVMARAVAAYRDETGVAAGLKPAGGIGTTHQALGWRTLVKEELGSHWLRPERFRIGASALLANVVRELEDHIPGVR